MIFRHLLNMRSHPTWVRGLKPSYYGRRDKTHVSHPTWVRGLKQRIKLAQQEWLRRTLRGCVD